jgi:hypothetical protein
LGCRTPEVEAVAVQAQRTPKGKDAEFQVAHVRKEGLDLIIVPMSPSFGGKSRAEQNEMVDELQMRAAKAQLAGAVVPVWDSGGGRLAFLAPASWHPFFNSLTLPSVLKLVNRELSW